MASHAAPLLAANDSATATPASEEEELQLDKEAFKREFEVAAVIVPARRTSEVLKRLARDILHVPKLRAVEPCPDRPDMRLILLKEGSAPPAAAAVPADDGSGGADGAGDPVIGGDAATAGGAANGASSSESANGEGGESTDGGGQGLAALSDDGRSYLTAQGFATTAFTVRLDYSHCSAEMVLKRLLGPRVPGGADEISTSFEAAGKLAHLNLRENLLPYKKLIGQVILEKNQSIKTVVNKIGSIETEFRTFPMEVLAGENRTAVEVRESGCSFRFDFAEVYWNSRLQTEHDRLIRLIEASGPPGKVTVCDMMAGVGPFAVPLAKHGYQVFANDLNPRSHAALVDNGRRNRCGAKLMARCLCARDFVRGLLADRKVFHHAIMNLPASALDFVHVFRGVDWAGAGFSVPPMVHVYCFSKAADPAADAIARANAALGTAMTTADVAVHVVRDVAPRKTMVCLTFQAPSAAAAAAGAITAAAAAAATADGSSMAKSESGGNGASTAAVRAASPAAATCTGAAAASPESESPNEQLVKRIKVTDAAADAAATTPAAMEEDVAATAPPL